MIYIYIFVYIYIYRFYYKTNKKIATSNNLISDINVKDRVRDGYCILSSSYCKMI